MPRRHGHHYRHKVRAKLLQQSGVGTYLPLWFRDFWSRFLNYTAVGVGFAGAASLAIAPPLFPVAILVGGVVGMLMGTLTTLYVSHYRHQESAKIDALKHLIRKSQLLTLKHEEFLLLSPEDRECFINEYMASLSPQQQRIIDCVLSDYFDDKSRQQVREHFVGELLQVEKAEPRVKSENSHKKPHHTHEGSRSLFSMVNMGVLGFNTLAVVGAALVGVIGGIAAGPVVAVLVGALVVGAVVGLLVSKIQQRYDARNKERDDEIKLLNQEVKAQQHGINEKLAQLSQYRGVITGGLHLAKMKPIPRDELKQKSSIAAFALLWAKDFVTRGLPFVTLGVTLGSWASVLFPPALPLFMIAGGVAGLIAGLVATRFISPYRSTEAEKISKIERLEQKLKILTNANENNESHDDFYAALPAHEQRAIHQQTLCIVGKSQSERCQLAADTLYAVPQGALVSQDEARALFESIISKRKIEQFYLTLAPEQQEGINRLIETISLKSADARRVLLQRLGAEYAIPQGDIVTLRDKEMMRVNLLVELAAMKKVGYVQPEAAAVPLSQQAMKTTRSFFGTVNIGMLAFNIAVVGIAVAAAFTFGVGAVATLGILGLALGVGLLGGLVIAKVRKGLDEKNEARDHAITELKQDVASSRRAVSEKIGFINAEVNAVDKACVVGIKPRPTVVDAFQPVYHGVRVEPHANEMPFFQQSRQGLPRPQLAASVAEMKGYHC